MSEFLWCEKYRPTTVDECILPKHLKDTFKGILETGELPNMMFTGTAGLGKTTIARALCNELDLDYILINGSEDSGIDVLRDKIRRFASSVSLMGGYKVVILDEADYLKASSTQPALRGFIEEFSDNCRFILTCNFKNRIIEPLHSRCGVYEFNTTKKDMQSLCSQFYQRITNIFQNEGVDTNGQMKDVAELIMKHAPDWRRVLNELQRASMGGVLDIGTLSKSNVSINELFASLKDKNFKKMRSWVTNNIDTDSAAIFRSIYDVMYEKVEPSSIPQLVLILADYQYKAAFVADQELNVVACMTEIMANVDIV
jgi:DNA polymerase III delta prime subunit